jgi:hypothetical protein
MATTSAAKIAHPPAAISGVHCIAPSTPALASVSLPASLAMVVDARAGGRGYGIENAPVSNAHVPRNPSPFSPLYPGRDEEKMTTKTNLGPPGKNGAPVRASRLDPTVERNATVRIDHGHDSSASTCIFALSTHFIFWSFSRAPGLRIGRGPQAQAPKTKSAGGRMSRE